MKKFNNYNNYKDGLDYYGPYREMRDKENLRYFIEGQIKDAKLSKRLIIFNSIVAFLALVVSIIALFK